LGVITKDNEWLMNADPGRSGRIYIRDIYIYTFVTSFGIVL
jgi:hypothetical protein